MRSLPAAPSGGRRYAPSSLAAKMFLPLMVALLCAFLPGTARAATVINGDFETGSLSGWTTNTTGNGAWVADSGTTAPLSGRPISAPPQGTYAAITDQNGPGSHVLYQDVVLAPGEQHTLSLTTYYQNDYSSFVTPNSLETNVVNQQYRIDVMKPTAPIRSVAGSDVLAKVFRTEVGDPLKRTPFGISFDLTPFAGQAVRLRFAAVQTQFYFRAGVDAVKVTSTSVDRDGDGLADTSDNCPGISNADQADLDHDGTGDACDSDVDGDGAANDQDAFPRDPAESKDTDGDGIGDNADRFPNDATEQADSDDDGVGDRVDNCRTTSNGDQADLDGDGQGDVCDDDVEGDGVIDTSDNCPGISNTDQADLDLDGSGDACDSDVDGDGTANGDDFAPRDPAEQKDTDGDGIGDNADRFPNDATESADADDDGIGDRADNCQTNANASQADLDADGKGDACDDDIDGDGILNEVDNAPRDPNADQQDLDKDGIGDVIDTKVLPLTAEMCKKDGFKRFYDGPARFKNQGDCVSFVATGGKNLPAGS